ncbi:GIY-YIG nuclease family protein [Litorivivens sp.]|uniref:GIY-YIG nuclease family protein n=1 Tax=Litorivivens sp. TaxID=2020868 RepID=UPI003563AD2A
MSKGYVYVLSNPSMPGVYKIGRSINGGEERAKSLYTTGVPEPFSLEYEIYCNAHEEAESLAHEYLSEFRVTDSREFFRCDLDQAVMAVCRACVHEFDISVGDCLTEEAAMALSLMAYNAGLNLMDVISAAPYIKVDHIKLALLELMRKRPSMRLEFLPCVDEDVF